MVPDPPQVGRHEDAIENPFPPPGGPQRIIGMRCERLRARTSLDQGTVRAAGECGYRSMAVLAGVVQAMEAKGYVTENDLFSYEGPFGVGYLVGEVTIVPAGVQQGGAI